MEFVCGDVSGSEFKCVVADPDQCAHDLCIKIGKHLGVTPVGIRLLNTQTNHFYDNEEDLSDIYKATNGSVFFQVIYPRLSNRKAPEVSQRFSQVSTLMCTYKARPEYEMYTIFVRSAPPDVKARVDRMVEIGYPRSDCEIVLRYRQYHIPAALEMLADERQMEALWEALGSLWKRR